MKILMVWHFLPYPPHGGAAQRNYHMLREISARHEVHLVSFNQSKFLRTEEQIAEATTALGRFCKSIRVFPIPTDSRPLAWYWLLLSNLLSLTPYSAWRFNSQEMREAIRELVSKVKFDVVHIDTIALAGYHELLGEAPWVLNHQNIESELMLRRARQETNLLVKLYLHLQGKKLERYERKMAARASFNAVVSDIDGRQLNVVCPSARWDIVMNGTDTDYFRPSNQPVQPALVFTGGMTWFPNRDAMIWFCREIYPLIKQERPDVELWVIGRFPPPQVQEAARRDSSIKVLGFVEDIRVYTAKAAVYVVPIRVGGGTRLKILDAMASGKAIISTTIGAEGLATTAEVNILIADTPAAFASQVLRVLADGALRSRLELNARQLVESRYAWHAVGEQLQHVYRAAMTS